MSFTFGKKRGKKEKAAEKSLPEATKKKYIVTIPLFGSPLEDLAEAYGTAIPTLIRETISLISKPGSINCPGLFVLDGQSPHWERAQELRDVYEREISVILQSDDIHAAAALLKIFLHELPLPVLTYELYELFMEASASRGEEQEVELLLDLQRIISMLPFVNKFVLSYLMTFFFRVSSHSEENGLNTANIGRIFGPLLLPPQETEREKRLEAQRHITRITQLLIEQYQVICFSLNSSSIPTKKDKLAPPAPTPSKVQLPTQVPEDLAVVTVRAFKEYTASNFTELSLRVGDYIRVLSQNPGVMWEGELDDKTGLFPAEYCEVIAVVKKLQYKVDLTRVNPKIRAFQNRLFEKKKEEEEEEQQQQQQKMKETITMSSGGVTSVIPQVTRPLGATSSRFQKPLSSRATRTMQARGAQPRRILKQTEQSNERSLSSVSVDLESKLLGEDHPLEIQRKQLKEQSETLEKETKLVVSQLNDLKKELYEQREHKKILDIQISSIEGELETIKDQIEKQEKNFMKAKQVRQQMEENLVSVKESFSKRQTYMDEVQSKMSEMGSANVFRGSQGFTGTGTGTGTGAGAGNSSYKNPNLANRPKSSSFAQTGSKNSLGSPSTPAVKNLRSQWESK